MNLNRGTKLRCIDFNYRAALMYMPKGLVPCHPVVGEIVTVDSVLPSRFNDLVFTVKEYHGEFRVAHFELATQYLLSEKIIC